MGALPDEHLNVPGFGVHRQRAVLTDGLNRPLNGRDARATIGASAAGTPCETVLRRDTSRCSRAGEARQDRVIRSFDATSDSRVRA
jgi:hypothetical protein